MINTTTNSVVATVPVGTTPVGVAVSPNGLAVYVTNFNGTVSRISTANNTVVGSPIVVGPQPYSVAVSADSTLAYVANSNDTVSVIDTRTNTVVRSVPIDTAPETGVHFIALSPDGARVYVTDAADRTLRISTMQHVSTATVSTVAGVSSTSIVGGLEAANMSAPAGKIGLIGTDAADLVGYNGYYGPHWKTAVDGTVGTVPYLTSSFGIDMWVSNSRYVELSGYAWRRRIYRYGSMTIS